MKRWRRHSPARGTVVGGRAGVGGVPGGRGPAVPASAAFKSAGLSPVPRIPGAPVPRIRRARRPPNPLRRPIDRAERLAMTALLAFAVIACALLGLYAGHRTDLAGLRAERAGQGTRQVIAVVQRGAAESASAAAWGVAWVPARWQLPDGQQQTGRIAVDLNVRAGQRIPIWVDPAGRPTTPPVTAADVTDQVMFVVLALAMGIAVVTALAAGGLRVLFNRRRLAGWQRAWDVVGPAWSRQA